MELHEQELEKARAVLQSLGKDPDGFQFDLSFMPPDPDGGGMYTVRYEVIVTHRANDKSLELIGGIGLDWVSVFEEAVNAGHFD